MLSYSRDKLICKRRTYFLRITLKLQITHMDSLVKLMNSQKIDREILIAGIDVSDLTEIIMSAKIERLRIVNRTIW